MTSIKIERNSQGRCISYTVLGHVHSPVVCAAISTLTQSTAMALSQVLNHRIRINSADGYFKVTLAQFPTVRTELFIDGMLVGLKNIQKQYQDVVYIVDKKKRKEEDSNEVEKG